MAGDSTGHDSSYGYEGTQRRGKSAAAHSVAPAPRDLLMDAVQADDVAALRAHVDRAFWGKEDVKAQWPHLFAALKNDNVDIVRLLVLHGARASEENMKELQDAAPEKYAGRLRLLRRAGHALNPALLKRAREAAAEQVLAAPSQHGPQPGDRLPDGTIYIGVYEPVDNKGRALGKVFNAYAAPEDMPCPMTYAEARSHLLNRNAVCGYQGEIGVMDDDGLYDAMRNGTYRGGWVIPPIDLLSGYRPEDTGQSSREIDSIARYRDTGAFRGGWNDDIDRIVRRGDVYAVYGSLYWSSSMYLPGQGLSLQHALAAQLGGELKRAGMDMYRSALSCRAVRFEERTPVVRRQEPAARPAGEEMPDGTIYAGISPDTGEEMFVAAKWTHFRLTFNEAAGFAHEENRVERYERADWRVPSVRELGVLYRNKDEGALKGQFHGGGDDFYLSSTTTRNGTDAYAVCFADGRMVYNDIHNNDYARLVCGPRRENKIYINKNNGKKP